MKLRIGNKLLLGLAGLFATLTATNYVIQRFIVMKQFENLEDHAAHDDLVRCHDAIQRELEYHSVLVRDWSSWDDPYQYILDRNQAFEDSNLKEAMWKTTAIHLMYFIGNDGSVVWGNARDVDYETPLSLSEFPSDRFPPGHELLADKLPLDGDPVIAGILVTTRGPMFVAARPILTSENKGPVRGTLIMGRFLTPERLEALRKQTCVQFEVYAANASDTPAQATAALARLSSPDDRLLQPQDGSRTLGYAYLPDPQGRPALLIEANIPRDISAQGTATMRFTLISMVAAAVLTCGLMFTLLRVIVVRPLEQFTARAAQIGETGDLTQRMGIERSDEIGMLSCEFDRMIMNLSETRAKLLETSREAGMADVATGVLHNVGNVLNSVNISTMMLVDNVKKSKVGGVARAAELLERNRANIAEFITQDERGRNLPGYLIQLAQTLADEQRSILTELCTLKTSVDHVNQVVQSQHTFACKVGHLEPTNLRELVSNALAIMEAAFKRHGIEWHADLAEIPATQLDTAKCTQVLVNLLTNAKEAVGALAKGDKHVNVQLRLAAGDAACIEVSDNGAGIAPENLTRIFANGFTTKPNGRGFGLHYCALAAKEMGGELSVHSDRLGRGACFTLRLPLLIAEKVDSA